jgi:hypothetical protein
MESTVRWRCTLGGALIELLASERYSTITRDLNRIFMLSAAPAPTLGRLCIPRGSAVPHMTPRPRVRAHLCPPAPCALIGAIARRATSIATSAAASNAPHRTARAFARMHRHRPGSRQNSTHKPRTGQRAIVRVRTSWAQRSHEQRASRRAHRSARRARPALAASQARGAPRRWGCHGRTPAGPPKGTQTPLRCRPQDGRGTGVGTR